MVCKPLTGQPLNLASEPFWQDWILDCLDIGIRILIEADHYWKLVTGKICQEGTGPTVIETKPSHGSIIVVNFASNHVLKVDSS